MLRWLGVINDDGESTGVWNKLRVDSTRQATLQQLVKDAYKGIFDSVDVEHATAADLRGAFVSAYSVGDSSRHIKCFLSLCRHAGIKTVEEATAREAKAKQNGGTKPKSTTPLANGQAKRSTTNRREKKTIPEGSAVNITLNVEIPADWSEEQIRERVAAVARALESADDS